MKGPSNNSGTTWPSRRKYAGRAVVALATDNDVLRKSGQLHHVADLAEEYDFTDVDGQRVWNFYRTLGLMPEEP